MNRLLDRLTERSLRLERAMVADGERGVRQVLRRTALRFAVATVAVVASNWLPDAYDGYGIAVLGGMAGAWAASVLSRAGAYRNGWLDGRRDMVQRLRADPDGWPENCVIYDAAHVMGLGVEVPDTLEGLTDDD